MEWPSLSATRAQQPAVGVIEITRRQAIEALVANEGEQALEA
jgi:hypothetical protein